MLVTIKAVVCSLVKFTRSYLVQLQLYFAKRKNQAELILTTVNQTRYRTPGLVFLLPFLTRKNLKKLQKRTVTTMKQNQEIRQTIKDAGLRHWQVADALGISESKLSKMFRYPLTDQQKQAVERAIKTIEGLQNEQR